jgi:hypothetical protein
VTFSSSLASMYPGGRLVPRLIIDGTRMRHKTH